MDGISYTIFINTAIENKCVNIDNCTLDEVVSVAIVFFDKFSTHKGDFVQIIKHNHNLRLTNAIRKIELKEGLKVEITAY